MSIKSSESTPIGTHPSYAASHTVLMCDLCGDEFHADTCVDGEWKLHDEATGYTDDSDSDQHICKDCMDKING